MAAVCGVGQVAGQISNCNASHLKAAPQVQPKKDLSDYPNPQRALLMSCGAGGEGSSWHVAKGASCPAVCLVQ